MKIDLKKMLSQIYFDKINRINFPGSMDPSEIFSFIYLLKKNKINLVIESGRQYGYSTYFLSSYCQKNNIKFISIDLGINKKADLYSHKILNKIPVEFNYGNFFFVIEKIIRSLRNKNIAMLIDGPKGVNAYTFCYKLLKMYNIKFILFDNVLHPKSLKFYNLIFKKLRTFKDLNFPSSIKIILNKLNIKHNLKIAGKPINDFGFITLKDYYNGFFVFLEMVFFYIMKQDENL
jgi:hypothetical protein